MPYKPRQISKDELTKLRESHVWKNPPTLSNTELVFITADTMDDFIAYAVFAWDVFDNIYMIECGEVPYIELTEEKRKQANDEREAEGKPPVKTLEDILVREWLTEDDVGVKASFLVIDQGGHRANDVKHFAKMHRNVMMQKGTAMTSMNWRFSDNQSKLIMSNEKFWKSTAIYYLYAQKNRQENFLFFNPSITEEQLAQIRDVVPDNTSKWGDDYSNWVSKTGNDHVFDCIKYAMLAKDFALQTFKIKQYRFGKAPSIIRRFEKLTKMQEHKQQTTAKNYTDWWKI